MKKLDPISNNKIIKTLEPIGGAKPKLSMRYDSLSLRETESQSLALICPAQGFPLPAFRYIKISPFGDTLQNLSEELNPSFPWIPIL